MSNLAKTFKDEMARLARKEIRTETASTKQAVASYRREIARLKRQLRAQEKRIALLESREQKRTDEPLPAGDDAQPRRFSAKSVKAQRKRLGLSAADYAKLVGVSPLTIYNWEHGKSRPRQAQMNSLVALRGIGKKEAAKKLDVLNGSA